LWTGWVNIQEYRLQNHANTKPRGWVNMQEWWVSLRRNGGSTWTGIYTFLCLTQLKAQTIDRDYIVKWIKLADTAFDVDAVVKYSIDRESYYTTDTAKLNNRLRQISLDRLKAIFFSRYKSDNYVPGEGTIYVQSIQQETTEYAKGWLDKAKLLFVDNYFSFSNHILTDAKDPVLIIDSRSIHHTEVKELLDKIKPEDIYDISVGQTPVPASMYGQNAKNGLVQIWTKKFMTK
ncbi:MAG: hypothetical protein NTW29_16540, partial [Bacteroidetes bacterium]|nr:hypothetical protein [Bacteroidota bacterium]